MKLIIEIIIGNLDLLLASEGLEEIGTSWYEQEALEGQLLWKCTAEGPFV